MTRGTPNRSPITLAPVLSAPAPAPVIPLRESSVISMARVGALDGLQVESAFRLANLVRAANAEAGRQFHEFVDGSRGEPLAEKATEAMKELRRVRTLLGRHGYALAVSVCAEGHALTDLYATRRQRDTAADLLRIQLDELARLWRLG